MRRRNSPGGLSVCGRKPAVRRTAAWLGLQWLEGRVLLEGSPFATGEFTPTGGAPTIIAGPGGLDGQPLMDLNGDFVGDIIVRYPRAGDINGPASQDVTAILSDGTSMETGVRNWREYRIARYASPNTIVSVATGDINGDDLPDVVVQWTATASASSNRAIDFFLSQPDGTFTTGQTINLGSLPRGANLSIFDATGDGLSDLFQQTDGKITVYKGNGAGSVTAPGAVTQIPISQSNGLDFSSDLTGDGIRDIAISGVSNDGFASAFIGVYRGSAAGTYSSTNFPIPAGFGSLATLQLLALENLDGDPALDIIAKGALSPLAGEPATLFVFRNNGTGTFTQSFSSGSFASGLYSPLAPDATPLLPFTVGDFDNDGDSDLAVMEGNLLINDITIHVERNNGNAGFSESQSIPVTAFPNTSRLLAVDMDDDGFDDLVVHHHKATGGTVTTVHFSQGNGMFDAGLDVDTGLSSATNARIVDFNNDGRQDLQFLTFDDAFSGFSLTGVLNNGKSFAAPVTTNLGSVAVPQEGGGLPSNFPILPVRDYDGDGIVDIIGNNTSGAPQGLTVIAGNADGSFRFLTPTLVFSLNGNASTAGPLGDFNMDGLPDLQFVHNGTGSIGVTFMINGTQPPVDTAGTDHTVPFIFTNPLTDRLTAIEHVTADAGADPRDRFDFFRFHVESNLTVRMAAIPDVAAVALTSARADGIGTGNDFPTGFEPVFIEKALTPGDWHINVNSFSKSETDYRLDIYVPAAGAAIGVYDGFEQLDGEFDSIDFGTIKTKTTDTRRRFLVRNEGLMTLNLSAVQFPAGFSLAEDTLVTTLAPGVSDYFTIKLDTSVAGTFEGDIVIPSNDPAMPSFVIPVTGTVEDIGVVAQPLIAVEVDGGALTSGQPVAFGTAAQGAPLPLQKVFTVRNDGDANLTVTGITLPQGFVLTEPLSPLLLPPNESDTFTVTVGTATAGSFAGSIVINSDSGGAAGSFTIPVSATVTGGGGVADLTGDILEVIFNKQTVTADDMLLPGDKVSVLLRTINSGTGATAAGNIDFTFYASLDEELDRAMDTPLGTFNKKLPALAGGGNNNMTFVVTLPAMLGAGNFFILADIDAPSAMKPAGGIAESDEGNNTAASDIAVPVVLAAGQVGDRANAKLTFQEADGTFVTITLAGGGTAEATVDPDTGAISIAVTDATPKSALTIATKAGVKGGDNTITLGDVTIETAEPGAGFGKITAATATLTGTLDSPDGATALTLLGASGATINLGVPDDNPKAVTALSLGRVSNTSLTSMTPIKSLKVIEWLDTDENEGVISAPVITSLSVTGAKKPAVLAGDFQADITGDGGAAMLGSAKIAGSLSGAMFNLTGATGALAITGNAGSAGAPVIITADTIKGLTVNGNVAALTLNLVQPFDPAKPKLSNLPKIAVKGSADGLNLTSAGNVGTISTGALSNSTIFIGLAGGGGLPTAADDFLRDPDTNLGAGLTSLTVTGGFASSSIAATIINAFTIPAPMADNGGNPFGFAATVIKSGKIGGIKQPDADKSGSIDDVTTPDFVVRTVD